MSRAFTPSKLKTVFPIMQESFVRLEKYMNTLLSENSCVNCSEVSNRVIADIIGNSFIGINMNILSTEGDQIHTFLKKPQLIRGTKGKQVMKRILCGTIPRLYDLIGYYLFRDDRIINFYSDFILEQIEYRKKHQIVKSDFVGLLMELRDNPGKLDKIFGKIFFILRFRSVLVFL